MFPKRMSIRCKVILFFILLLLVVIGAFTIFSYTRISRILQDEIEKRAIDVTRTFTQMASGFIFESDYVTVLDNARELLQNRDILSITVTDSDGLTWISTRAEAPVRIELDSFYQAAIRDAELQQRKIRSNGQWIIECVNPILALSKVAYLVSVRISLHTISAQLVKSTQNIILLSLVMLYVAVWLGIWLSRRLTGPIEELVRGTQEIGKGNLKYRIKATTLDEIGELAGSFNRMTDNLMAELSERKRVETELRRHRDHLEEIVEDRTQELKGVVKDLQIEIAERKAAERKKMQLEARLQRSHKMEAIGTLAGGVAHDLNNILSAIVSYPDLLLMQLPEDSPLIKPLVTIQDSGLKAAAIVQDLLTLARRGVAITEVVNLNHVIADYLKSPEYECLIRCHPSIDVQTHLDSSLMNIKGSRVHLQKSLMNIIVNAVEAMPAGGRLCLATENRYVDHAINGYENVREGDYVTLTISDTGTGIAARDLERIFEPFFTTKTMGKSGTGLGMAVVWGTVKDHKGYIDVRSQLNLGTTFTLYFPVTRQQLAKVGPSPGLQGIKGQGESILVVDDVAQQREIASAILAELNYKVISVGSGEEALEYLTNHSIDLVLLDMVMTPGMDGLDTYNHILRLHPDQKAVIVSGFSETQRVKEAQRLGAGVYIKKPYMLEKIGSAIRSELNRP
jgi:signal transduction histidine kinase/CheY-like chemotaxis protein